MVEYINRKALLQKAWDADTRIGYVQVVDLGDILDMPVADVAPVVHGRWISNNPHGYEWTFVCSNCGYVDGYPFNDRHNYCPHCGATMDEKEAVYD